ncbi:MAG TPA: teichoic acid D-Ala incorporation-associated protein DltX [Verrucomicrobiaceae bacterium]|jgi:hypothetical protein
MSAPETPRSLRWRTVWLTVYYLLILAAVIYLHGRGGLETPSFIYQGF